MFTSRVITVITSEMCVVQKHNMFMWMKGVLLRSNPAGATPQELGHPRSRVERRWCSSKSSLEPHPQVKSMAPIPSAEWPTLNGSRTTPRSLSGGVFDCPCQITWCDSSSWTWCCVVPGCLLGPGHPNEDPPSLEAADVVLWCPKHLGLVDCHPHSPFHASTKMQNALWPPETIQPRSSLSHPQCRTWTRY